MNKARIFLLVGLWIFFYILIGPGDEKKCSENDQLTGHFQSFFIYFFYFFFNLFFNISRTNSKISKVNQQSVLNL